MTDVSSIAAIVLAAGSGSRSRGAVPKQYRTLAGRPLLAHSIEAMQAYGRIGAVVLVVPVGGADEAMDGVIVLEGGATRRLSVRNALEALAGLETAPSHVLIHDSARPLLPSAVLDRLIGALENGAAGVMPVCSNRRDSACTGA